MRPVTAEELHAAFTDPKTGIVDELAYMSGTLSFDNTDKVDGDVDFLRLAEWINDRMK